MKTLLHTCCAPCSIYCVDSLRQEGIDAEEALTFAAKRFAREAKHQSNG